MHLVLYGVLLGLLIGGVFALMASGLALVWGVMRIINLAQAAFVILGAYLDYTAFVRFHIDPFVAIVPVGIVMFGIGVGVFYLFFRPLKAERTTLSILVSYAVLLGCVGALGSIYSTNDAFISPSYVLDSWEVLGFQIPLVEVGGFFISAVLVGGLFWFLSASRLGRAIRAATQNPSAATLLGVRTDLVGALGFGIGTATAAVAGAIYGMIYSFNPNSSLDLVGILLCIVVVGGFGSLSGAIVAALALGISSSLVFVYQPVWSGLGFYGILAVVLLVRPQGLWGVAQWRVE
ncbi:MAG TPA: branched-chain amino acid ABC transporter permease [Candidatus Dormibacteraeota bacterium]|nr:branched-chain amino acid ABC transporter permease [Candidatus Dormibacteraeota bacterium]